MCKNSDGPNYANSDSWKLCKCNMQNDNIYEGGWEQFLHPGSLVWNSVVHYGIMAGMLSLNNSIYNIKHCKREYISTL
jgi:hypothetical protein